MKSKVYIKYIISYLIVLIIPVILLSFLIYGKFVKIMTEEVTNNTSRMLYQIRDVVDVRIQEIVDISALVSTNNRITPIISNEFYLQENSYPEVYNAIMELKNYKISNSLIDSIFIFFKNKDIIVSDTSKYTFKHIFSEVYSFEDISYKELYDKLNSLGSTMIIPSKVVNNYSRQFNVVSYLRPLPINNYNTSAVLMITLKDSMFKQLIKNVLNEYNSSVFILDGNNKILSSTTVEGIGLSEDQIKKYLAVMDEKTLYNYITNDGDRIINCVKSKSTGWSYVAVIPSVQILAKVNYIKRLSVIIIVVALLLSAVLAFSFSRGNYSKIRKITDAILSSRTHNFGKSYKNEWELINQSIYDFIDENDSLQKKLSDQMPVLRNNFYMRLLEGDFSDMDAVNSMMEFLRLKMEHGHYAAFLISIDEYRSFSGRHKEPEQGVIRVALLNAFEEICAGLGKGYAVEIDRSKLAVIVGIDNAENVEEQLKTAGNGVVAFVNKNFDFTVTAGLSNIHPGMPSICEAYREAANAVDFRMIIGNNTVISYEDIKDRDRKGYYYSFRQEAQVLNYLRAGDYGHIKELLDEIVASVRKEAVSLEAVKCIYLEIINTALKSSKELGIDNAVIEDNLPSLVNMETLNGVCGEVSKFYLRICEHINKLRSSKNSLLRKVTEYIENNFYNKSLSVELLADEFSVSPSYLSRYFKEQTNLNFTDYVHGVRLAKAKELLTCSEFTVADIADKVGYNSIHNFTRVFKRYEDITPTDFRLSEVNKGKC